jgi:hypothetical protein
MTISLDDLLGPEPEPSAAEKRAKSLRDNFGLDITNGADIVLQAVDWIWDNHLALGQHTCIAGVQGDGKSQLVYRLVAAITTGGKWPGTDEKAPQGHCIVLNAEDAKVDMLGPRLVAAGADMKFVTIVNAVTDNSGATRKFNLQADLERLTDLALKMGNVKLITFDPVSSYLGGDLDSHENTQLRDALDPITAMAWKTGAAVISVTHFNKSAKGVSALNRVMGGTGFTAAPRAAFAVIRDAKNPSVRMLLSLKSNIAAEGAAYGMCFTLGTKDVGEDKRNSKRIVAPYVVWGEKTTMTADEALAANNKKIKGPTKQEEAESFLIQMLGRGPVLVRDVEAASDKRGIAPDTLRRAKKGLGVISEKVEQRDGRGPWMMSLPDDFFSEASPRPAPLAGEEPDFDWPDAKTDFNDDDPADRVLN